MANLQQIVKHLENLQLPYKTVRLKREAFMVGDVETFGFNRADVVKTLVIRTNDGFAALALLGNDRVNFKKIRAKFGSRSELARPGEVLEAVGVPIGAVCPILVGIPLYIDGKVLNLQKVHMGSGDLGYGLEMKLDDLVKAVGKFEVYDFSVSN